MSSHRNHIVVFSGGSAANSLVDVFGKVAEDKGCALSYIIPISDNGGSSSELIRVFGGPGIGDVRSRLIRLIPLTLTTAPLKALLSHRLPTSPTLSTQEWHTILHGSSPLWSTIPSPTRELLRSFLNHLNLEIIKRSRPLHSVFNFSSASLGNLFLTGARLFTGSFEAAIYLMSIIGGIDESKTQVIPAINSNFSHHISAGLANGDVITGQNAISHPTASTAGDPLSSSSSSNLGFAGAGEEIHDYYEDDAHPPQSLPTLRQQNIAFEKSHNAPLPARIEKIWYINPYGQPILPSPNPKVLSVLQETSVVVYSIGSLWTSIIPCLVLRGVGERLRDKGVRSKVFLLNGCTDRETGGYGAGDFVKAVVEAFEGRSAVGGKSAGGEGKANEEGEGKEVDWKQYVTHLIYMEGEGTPVVDREMLGKRGIECVKIYGRRNEEGEGMCYDGAALGQALEAIIGRSQGRGEKTRRYTLER